MRVSSALAFTAFAVDLAVASTTTVTHTITHYTRTTTVIDPKLYSSCYTAPIKEKRNPEAFATSTVTKAPASTTVTETKTVSAVRTATTNQFYMASGKYRANNTAAATGENTVLFTSPEDMIPGLYRLADFGKATCVLFDAYGDVLVAAESKQSFYAPVQAFSLKEARAAKTVVSCNLSEGSNVLTCGSGTFAAYAESGTGSDLPGFQWLLSQGSGSEFEITATTDLGYHEP